MISKTNYRKWLNSDNEKVRNSSFQAAFVTHSVSLEDLIRDYPELIEKNLTVALMRRPELWNDFIEEVIKLEKIPVKLITEIVGMVSFYLKDSKLDFDKAFKLVDSYVPDSGDAGLLVVSLMICIEGDDRWLTIALNKVKKINAEIEEPLLEFLRRSGCPSPEQYLILDRIMKEVDYSLKAKIVNQLLQSYGIAEETAKRVVSYLTEYRAGLTAFMYYLINWLQDVKIPASHRIYFAGEVLELLICHKISLPQGQRKQFFAVLDFWLGNGNPDSMEKLDRYLEVFPNDAGKVFRLYSRVIVKISRSKGDNKVSNSNWFGFVWNTNPQVKDLINKAFDIRYIKALRRYGRKDEQTEVFMLALNGAATTDDLICKRAEEILNLFVQAAFLTGCINELLPQLEKILQQNKALVPYINRLLDLLLAKDYALNHVSVVDLRKVDDFCNRYALKADNFYEKYKDALMDMWEKQNEEDEIINLLETELAI